MVGGTKAVATVSALQKISPPVRVRRGPSLLTIHPAGIRKVAKPSWKAVNTQPSWTVEIWKSAAMKDPAMEVLLRSMFTTMAIRKISNTSR